jgi:uncharacterized protein YqjF (DUF2071 family)
MSTMTSRWSDLVLLTYELPEGVARRHLPHSSLDADQWQRKTHATVVALHFGTVRLAGVGVPGTGDFPQLNLRIPVKRGDEAGLVFIREFVPSPIVASFARLFLRQPYRTLPIRRIVTPQPAKGEHTVEYTFDSPPRGCAMITGSTESAPPERASFEHYCMHRLTAFGTLPGLRGRLARFPIRHPEWAIRRVLRSEIQIDYGAFFGAEWRFLNDVKPVSMILAVGSDVELHAPAPV